MEKKKVLLADLGLLFTAFVWGSGFIAQKSSLEALGPYNQMAVRFALSSILMALVFFKKVKQIKKSDLKPGILIGCILFAAYSSQTIGLQYSEVGTAAFITASNVVMVPFIFWLVKKQRPDNYNMVAALMCAIGIAMISLKGGLVVGKGDGFMLTCAFLFACHITAVGIYAKNHDPVILTILQLAVAAVFSIIFAVVFESSPFPIAPENWFGLLYLAVFSTLICFLLQNVCQKHTSPSHAAILLCLESVFGTLLGILLFKESFNVWTVTGFVIVFLAVITAETKWAFLKKK